MYHVLNRATGRLRIFRKHANFEAFERVLAQGVERVGIGVLDCMLNLNRFAMLFKEVPPLRHATLRSACLRSG